MLHQGGDELQRNRFGKGKDISQLQLRRIGLLGLGLLLRPEQTDAVFLNADNVGVGVCHLHQGAASLRKGLHDDLEVGFPLQKPHLAQICPEQCPGLLHVLRLYAAEDLQALLRVACQSAQNGAGLDAPHVVGGRHDDRFYIFDDVTAASDFQPLGKGA